MKTKLITVLIILCVASTLFSKDYTKKITGTWRVIKLTTAKRTINIPQTPNTVITFLFKENGQGIITMKKGAKLEIIYFTWKIKNNKKIEMLDYKTSAYKTRSSAENDIAIIAFFDNKMIIAQKPDDNMIFQKIK